MIGRRGLVRRLSIHVRDCFFAFSVMADFRIQMPERTIYMSDFTIWLEKNEVPGTSSLKERPLVADVGPLLAIRMCVHQWIGFTTARREGVPTGI